jgi:hypothetical protein
LLLWCERTSGIQEEPFHQEHHCIKISAENLFLLLSNEHQTESRGSHDQLADPGRLEHAPHGRGAGGGREGSVLVGLLQGFAASRRIARPFQTPAATVTPTLAFYIQSPDTKSTATNPPVKLTLAFQLSGMV